MPSFSLRGGYSSAVGHCSSGSACVLRAPEHLRVISLRSCITMDTGVIPSTGDARGTLGHLMVSSPLRPSFRRETTGSDKAAQWRMGKVGKQIGLVAVNGKNGRSPPTAA